jgi:hypothetical protein
MLRNVKYSCFSERERGHKDAEGPEKSRSVRILHDERPFRPRHIFTARQTRRVTYPMATR